MRRPKMARDEAALEEGFHYEATAASTTSVLERVEVLRGQRMRNHHHDRPHLVLVLDGVMVERRGSQRSSLEPGTIRVNGAATHDLEFPDAGFRCLVLETDHDGFDIPVGSDDFHAISHDGAMVALIRHLERHLAGSVSDAALLDLDAAELFSRFVRWNSGRVGAPPAWLARVREMVAAGHQLPELERLAAEAGVHPNHLVRAFRDHFGITLGDFHRRLRVTRAARSIVSGRQSLAAVAMTAGYCDQSHLSRALRKYLDTTPRQLRAKGARGAMD